MITVGYRPVAWHAMRLYAYWGFKDFVLCLECGPDLLKEHFLRYNEALSNDSCGPKGAETSSCAPGTSMAGAPPSPTRLARQVGQRLGAAGRLVEDEDMFCPNYGDILASAALPELVEDCRRQGKVAACLSVRPPYLFHLVDEPFRRLIAYDQLLTYQHEGFWLSMDTLKDLQSLQTPFESGRPPWALWLAPQQA
jgi:glucose-1-phosphate cytidylyltransferase